MEKNTISLCMIVKNEEKNLKACLESVKDIADEIIVVDTGSTDKTKQIAKKFNAKVLDFEWINDFAAARNESIRYATKDWILVLDADEILDEQNKKEVKELVKDNETDGFVFLQKNYTNDAFIAGFNSEPLKFKKADYKGWFGTLIVRLFRNNRGFEFVGAVHETIDISIRSKNGKIRESKVEINNYGNTNPEIVRKKTKFYLELAKKKVKQNPSERSYYELGVLYKGEGDFENAGASFKKALEFNQKDAKSLYELGIVSERKGNLAEAIKYYVDSVKIKEDADTLYSLGLCYIKINILPEAAKALGKALLVNPNKYAIYNALGSVLEKMGDWDSAISTLRFGIKLNPIYTVGYYNLGVVLDKRKDYENALKCYERAVELNHKNKDLIGKRIEELKEIIKNSVNYKGLSFNVGK